MGVVYLATDVRMSRKVAVKLMIHHAAGARAWFLREAKVAASVTHPNVVRILDYGEVQGVPYLVSELLEGRSLDEQLRRGATTRDVLNVVAEVAAAMAHCHRGGLVHRDLKPSNVFLDLRGNTPRAVVLDFGLAFLRDAAGTELGRITGDGMICGTPAYMSPEQCQGTEISSAVDVYALGCLLFEALAGRLPFEGSTHELLAAHALAEPPRLRELDVELDPRLEALVATMLAKDPQRRPAMRQVASELVELVASITRDTMVRNVRGPTAPTWSAPRIALAQPPQRGAAAGAPLGSIAVIGPIDDQVLLALSAAGYRAERRGEVGDADLALLAMSSEAELHRLLAAGAPVVVMTAKATDFSVISRLLEAGVRDVIAVPYRPDEVVRKITRLLTRKRRTV